LTARRQRSELAVPASSARFIEKATQCEADAVFLDLEDAVAPGQKLQARANAIAALNDLEWGTRMVSVRVNGLDTPWGSRDILEIAEACPRLDRIVLPKCDGPGHVRAVELMLGGVEQELVRQGVKRTRIGLEALIESARGLATVEAIAASGGRLEALVFGAVDFQLDMHMLRMSGDALGFALARIATACRAYGLLPIDGPYTNIKDLDGARAAAERAAALGFEGKWAIHPSQIALLNEVFSPSAEQIAWAHEVLAALGADEGRGALKGRDGEMIDLAHVKMARRILDR
jgi:malyl-CoA/(S)-citramalyl-CoA lyase